MKYKTGIRSSPVLGRGFFTFCLSAKNKTPTLLHRGIIGAANQNRTDDLILTKDVLYQLSHSSVFQIDEHYYIRKLVVCQVFFELFLKTVNISARTVGFVMAGSELRCDGLSLIN